jgi:hypothetical protein
MSKIENLLEISKRMISINYTNLESLEILKDEKSTEYVTKLSECHEKNSQDDSVYFLCILKSLCPEQSYKFSVCQKENSNNLSICTPLVYKLDDCMRSYSDRVLQIIKKAKNY